MRIWDISPKKLCNRHLFGEHRELHAIWSILINNKKGYSQHPETKRWVGKQAALFTRHERLVKEILGRGYKHQSPLNKRYATGITIQRTYVNTKAEQHIILKHKDCDCPIK